MACLERFDVLGNLNMSEAYGCLIAWVCIGFIKRGGETKRIDGVKGGLFCNVAVHTYPLFD